ncbi:MAG: hypothetical protein ACJ8FY_08010 [Gemmataceae bacterium]
MSTQPPVATPMNPDDVEIKIVSHSNLFYWWPVWAVGYLLALLTWADGHLMAIVPNKEDLWKPVYEKVGRDSYEEHEGVIFRDKDEDKPAGKGAPAVVEKPRLHVAQRSSYGVLFATVLLLVIVITNVPLRGLWSFVIIIFVVMLSIIFALSGLWDSILRTISLLDIRINMAGYALISTVLFIIWLVTFTLFDQQLYMIFTPGQLKVRTEIGGGEKAYDTAGMTVEKQRSDLFRHWVLGLGSGDLIVNTSGANAHHFDLPNVLFVGRKVQQIEDMLREKAVVKGRS